MDVRFQLLWANAKAPACRWEHAPSGARCCRGVLAFLAGVSGYPGVWVMPHVAGQGTFARHRSDLIPSVVDGVVFLTYLTKLGRPRVLSHVVPAAIPALAPLQVLRSCTSEPEHPPRSASPGWAQACPVHAVPHARGGAAWSRCSTGAGGGSERIVVPPPADGAASRSVPLLHSAPHLRYPVHTRFSGGPLAFLVAPLSPSQWPRFCDCFQARPTAQCLLSAVRTTSVRQPPAQPGLRPGTWSARRACLYDPKMREDPLFPYQVHKSIMLRVCDTKTHFLL